MTIVGFNVHRVMATVQKIKQEHEIKQQEQQELQSGSIPVFRIFESAKNQLEKLESKYLEGKKKIIVGTAIKLENAGFKCSKICHEITKQLSDYASEQYIRECLSSKYKDSRQATNAASGAANRANNAKDKAIKEAIKLAVEAYEIDYLERYPKEYLCQIIRWQESTLKQYTHNQDEIGRLTLENEDLKERVKELEAS